MDSTTLYQHGTLALLVPGLFDGTINASEILRHGDTGLGTLEGLDGEVIIIDGKIYQAREDGTVHLVSSEETMPFASAHFNDISKQKNVKLKNIDKENVEKDLLMKIEMKNVFAAVKIQGTFNKVDVRVAPKQNKPYPSLTSSTAVQPEFTSYKIKGSVVGYYTPNLYSGITVPGFHLHFISDDRKFGGHILNFDISLGDVSVQILPNLNLHLPVDNTEFMKENFNLDILDEEINKAER